MNFERVVRPFQAGDVFNARRAAPVQQPLPGSDDVAHLEWSGKADAKWTEEPQPVLLGVNVVWEEDHTRRVTEKVKVTNPSDSSQFVEVERIKQMVMRNSSTREEIPFKMDWGT